MTIGPPRKRSILPRVLVASALALAASSGYLWMRLSAESDRAQDASRTRDAQALEIARLERQRDVLERELTRLRRAALGTGSCDHEQGTSAPGEIASGAAGARTSPPPGASVAGIPAGLRRMSALHTYGELARELKLSPEQTDEFIDLIVEQEEASFVSEARLSADPALLQQRFEAMEQRKEAAIAEFLGPERAMQYRDYRKSLGQRGELRMIRDHLEVLGTPLADKQRQGLLAIMIEEAARSPAPKLGPTSTAQDFEQLQRQQAETQRRVRERAESVLDPDQQKRLDEYYAMQQPLPALAGMAGKGSPHGEEE